MSTLKVDTLQKADGTEFAQAGHVVQVQQYQAYPAYMNLSSDSFAATNMTVTICLLYTSPSPRD